MVETLGKAFEPKPTAIGLPPEKKQPQPGWRHLQVVKRRFWPNQFIPYFQ
jgi:hypothetical protein